MEQAHTLKLRRRAGEKVLIGTAPQQVLVEVKHINDEGEVTLAFRADPAIPIDRLEVAKRKEREAARQEI